MSRESLIVYLDSGKKATLREVAREEDRSLSAYARRVLEAHAKALEERRRKD